MEDSRLVRTVSVRETQRDDYLARQKPEDVTSALKMIDKWFPNELVKNGEKTAVYLLLEALNKDQRPSELEHLPGWIFSVIPEVDKTWKGLVHQYRIATAANKVLE